MLMKPQQRASVRQGVLLRTYGVVFLLVLAMLIGLTIAIYNKTFVDVVTVTLETNRVGNQLAPPADVKVRGMIVGEVREVVSNGERARIEMALQPDKVDMIPRDVRARLLPKTLFGEKFVELVVPPGPATGPSIGEGDVIPQDRSATAIELETVLDNLLPLLRTIKPEKLNATLNAFATALEGRGERIGENLELVDAYFTEFNPHLEAFKTDITGMADVTEIYADAAPDLVRMLRNFSVSTSTIQARREAYAGFLAGTTGFATTMRDFLAENEQRIIQVNSVGRPTLELLARYSPEYPCLLAGLTESNDFIGQTFANGELHITLEVVRQRRGYEPGEEPRFDDHRGPRCYGLPDPPKPWPGNKFNDGTRDSGQTSSVVPGFAEDAVDPTSGPSGTAAEQGVVDALVAPTMGVRPAAVPDLATLLFGPMARGTAVRHS